MGKPFVAACLFTILCSSPTWAVVRYVDDNAPPGGDGLSWATASNNLFATLGSALPNDDIHVAAGTYKPQGPTQLTSSFNIRNGMKLLGGYAGYGAPNPDDQSPSYFTILTGDLNGNDAPNFVNRSDNAPHVVQVLALTPPNTAACVIDSFTIVGGNNTSIQGGGIYAQGPCNISRCIIRDNYGYQGGGLYGDKTCNVTDCAFESNKAVSGGGAVELAWTYQNHSFRRCRFFNNSTTGGYGGAVDFYYAYPLFVNCTFAANHSTGNGGAIKGSYLGVKCINCGFFGNSCTGPGSVGGAIWVESAGVLTGCVFSGNNAASYGGAANGIAEMYNCTVANNHSNSYTGGVQGAYTMTVRNCIFWGNNDPQYGTGQAAQLIYYGTLQIDHTNIQGWTGSYGGTANTGLDPRFILPAGNDAVIGTEDDNLRLLPASLPAGSPCLDSGDNAGVPADVGDVDGDNDTAETLPLDVDGAPRIGNDSTVLPDADVVNRGAYENDHPPPHVVAWRSVRTHAVNSPSPIILSIPLGGAVTGNGITGPTVEPRNGGIRRIEVDFDSTVLRKTGGSVSAIGRTTDGGGNMSGPVDFSSSAIFTMADTDTLRIDFSSLPPFLCLEIDIANAVVDMSNAPLATDTTLVVRSLYCDETSSGDITLSDVLLLKSRLGFALSAAPGLDVNLNGVIDATDVQITKSRVHSPPFMTLCP